MPYKSIKYLTMSKSSKCDQSHLRFNKDADLKQHVKHRHSERKPFGCELCDYGSKLKRSVTNHLKTHFPEMVVKSFSCSECSYKCASNSTLKAHLMIHTGEKPFACELCSYTTTTRSHLARHAITHTAEKPLKCSQCDFACALVENLRRHVDRLHFNQGARPFPCSFPGCAKKYTNNSNLKMHVLSIHKKKRRFPCPFCPKEFYTNSARNQHIQRHHTKEKRFKCNTCDYTAVTANEVTQHKVYSHGDFLGLECPVCHKACKNNKSLALHRSRSHPAQPRKKLRIKCEVENCEKQFADRSGLRVHIKAFHLKQRPFKCLFCEHSAANSESLNAHIKTHTGEKPYKCELCGRCFASNSSLGTHKATAHSESRPFKCDLCEFSTKTRQCLRNHRATHSPVPTNYECVICKESGGMSWSRNTTCPKLGAKYLFRRKSSLADHMKRHSDERPYKCHLCDYSAKLNKNLTAHLRRIHRVLGQQTPSVAGRMTKGLRSEEANQATVPITNSRERLASSGTEMDNVGNCKPCFVRLVHLKGMDIFG